MIADDVPAEIGDAFAGVATQVVGNADRDRPADEQLSLEL